MGLDTTYRIVKDYGGDIRFDSRPGETRFTVRLPLAQQ
jgi:signal transduction histidine kinase